MYKHILVPTDGSELSQKAVRGAMQMAKALGAQVTGFFATEAYPLPAFVQYPPWDLIKPDAFRAMQEAKAKAALAYAASEAEAAGVPFKSLVLTSDAPYKAIIDAAQQTACDLIFMASHGRRGSAARVLGSETNKVLVHSSVPVLVWR
jgi:nucleotide-binding universal stress UspA family protein